MAERFIEYVALEDLVGADVNPKRHATEDLAVSLREFGYTEPVLMDERTGKLVAGHGRLEMCAAARAEGLAAPDGVRVDGDRWLIPVTRGWASRDDNHASRYLVASNRLTEKGGWDDRALYDLLDSLADTDGLVGTGYDTADLDAMLASLTAEEPAPALTDPDDVPEPPAEAVTSTGDLWLLGPHRLLCGSATVDADLTTLMGEGSAQMLWTDPPYGVSYAAKNEYLNSISPGNRIQVPIEGDHMTPDDMSALWVAAFTNIRKRLDPGASYYVTGPQGGDLLLLLLLALRDCGFPLRHMIIWAKNQFVLGRSDYNYKHEPMIYGWVDGAHTFLGGGGESSVWEIDKPHASKLHPTMKPVELIARSIRNSLPPGQVVLDPFGGSGTTIIAAHQEGRVGYSSELSPAYCDVICRRFQAHTGVVPILESTGQPVPFG